MPKEAVAKKKVVKKRVAKKAPARKTTVRKAVAKKASPAKARKATAKKAASKKTTKKVSPLKGREATWVDKDKHGFAKGSMLSEVAEILVAGGSDRREVIDKARKVIGGKTSGGQTRNVAVAVHNCLTKLQERGYTVQSSWKVVPPKKKR